MCVRRAVGVADKRTVNCVGLTFADPEKSGSSELQPLKPNTHTQGSH